MDHRRLSLLVLSLACWLSWGSAVAHAAQTPPPTPHASGGPDGFGYTFIDSNDPGPMAPTFLFIDIAASGTPRLIDRDGNSHLFLGRAATPTPLMLSDDGEVGIGLSFFFRFYTVGGTVVRIGNNGGLLFPVSTGDVDAANVCPLPSTTSPSLPRMWVHWDDLDDDRGDVWIASFDAPCPHPADSSRCFVIQWDHRDHKNGLDTETGTFQVVLYESGVFLYQYLDVDFGDPALDGGASATVGIERPGLPDYFLEYQCNEGLLSNNLAILWLGGPPIPVELQSFSIE